MILYKIWLCLQWDDMRGMIWAQAAIHIYIYNTCRVRSEGRQKACRPTAPKMGPHRSASERNVSKGAGMPLLLCSKHARWNFDCHKQCKEMCTASGSVQDSQTSKLTYFRTLQSSCTRKGSKTGVCEWQRWFLGGGAMSACAYPHTSRGSRSNQQFMAAQLKRLCPTATKDDFTIRFGSAANLLRMRSRAIKDDFTIRIRMAAKLLRPRSTATKDDFTIRIGSAAKLLRMRPKATKDDFTIRIGSAAKLLRKASKEWTNSFFFSLLLKEILSSFASKPLWFVTHPLVVFHGSLK